MAPVSSLSLAECEAQQPPTPYSTQEYKQSKLQIWKSLIPGPPHHNLCYQCQWELVLRAA